MMTILAAVGGALVLNHIMMLIWTHVFDGDDWYDGIEYLAISMIRWIKMFGVLCILALAGWIVQEGIKQEVSIKAEAVQMHCVPIEDNTPAEDPIQY